MQILQYPMFENNYGFIVTIEGLVITIDPGDAKATNDVLLRNNLKLSEIWLTHHHADHVGGVKDLGRNLVVDWSQQKIRYGAEVLHLFGHTSDHLGFYFKSHDALFCGDVLFNLGCGRIFDGTYEQMWESLNKIKMLPDETKVYCAHEYTLSNYRFAQFVGVDLNHFDVDFSKPTVPFLLGPQKKYNPFLNASSFEEFKIRRDLKNSFG